MSLYETLKRSRVKYGIDAGDDTIASVPMTRETWHGVLACAENGHDVGDILYALGRVYSLPRIECETFKAWCARIVEAMNREQGEYLTANERIKDLTADVTTCHRTIAAGTRELEDARAIIESLQADALDAERLMSEQGAAFESRSAELHAEIMRLTGKVEELTSEVGLTRMLWDNDKRQIERLKADGQNEIERAQRAESRIDNLRDVFRDTVHLLVERL